MKKIISLAVTVLICLSMFACGRSTETVYITGTGEGSELSGVTKDMDFMYSREKREDAPQSLDIEFENITINGTYRETAILTEYNCDYDRYEYTDESGTKYSVGKNIKTGEIVYFTRSKNGENTMTESDRNTREERLNIAKEYLERYSDGDYRLCDEQESDWGADDIRHTFLFKRYINDLPTSDVIWICINTKGELCLLRKDVSPSFYDAELPDIDMEKCDSLVTEKAKEIIGKEDVTISDKWVKHLKDGQYGVEYKFEYDIEKDGEVMATSAIWLFVYAR